MPTTSDTFLPIYLPFEQVRQNIYIGNISLCPCAFERLCIGCNFKFSKINQRIAFFILDLQVLHRLRIIARLQAFFFFLLTRGRQFTQSCNTFHYSASKLKLVERRENARIVEKAKKGERTKHKMIETNNYAWFCRIFTGYSSFHNCCFLLSYRWICWKTK